MCNTILFGNYINGHPNVSQWQVLHVKVSLTALYNTLSLGQNGCHFADMQGAFC